MRKAGTPECLLQTQRGSEETLRDVEGGWGGEYERQMVGVTMFNRLHETHYGTKPIEFYKMLVRDRLFI